MKIHEKIRLIRKSKGISQVHIAKALELSVAGYNMKELGKRPITTDELEIIANALGVQVRNFFEDNFHVKWNKNSA